GAGSGGMREGRVLSRVNPSIPSCMKRSCQRQTTVLPLPTARVMALGPAPSAVRTMIRARQTCFCGLLRLPMIVSSRTRSSAVTVMEIPLRITDIRTKPNLQKPTFGLFCLVLSTSFGSGTGVKRRNFMTVLAGGVAYPLLAEAQQKAMPVIGWLSAASPGPYAPFAAAFRQGSNDAGYVEGQDVAIDYRWANGESDRLAALAADLVRRKVDVIAALSLPAALAAKS